MLDEFPNPFRSEQMSLVQLYVPTEVAHDTVYELGQLGNVQFKDLNPEINPFQRSFVGEVRRSEEFARRIRFFKTQLEAENEGKDEKERIEIRDAEGVPTFASLGPAAAQALDQLQTTLEAHEERLKAMNDAYKDLGTREQELEEARHVLMETARFFRQAEEREDVRLSLDELSASAPLLQHEERTQQYSSSGADVEVPFIAGVIPRARVATFERVLWRILRGNLYMNHIDITDPFVDPITKVETYKNVFIIFAHGDVLSEKVRKVAENMGGTIYPIDANADKRSDALRVVTTRLEDIKSVLYNTVATRRVELTTLGENIMGWQEVVRREALVYETLNLFNYDVRRRALLAEGWVPTRDITIIQSTLKLAAEEAGSNIPAILHEIHTNKTPPTFHRTNKFTEAFQAVMDSYGTAKYQEVNPGLFAVITFPFLFSAMFGDIGHGAIIFLFALGMILNERRLAKANYGEIFDLFFFGRYIILLMGLFSMYSGLLYNDIFSKTLHLWESGWDFPKPDEGNRTIGISTGHTYIFGLDPAWHGAQNKLIFTNSYKMKLSIILGICHMTFALCLQVPNHLKFKRRVDLWGNFVPQLIFLHSIFGYLVLCILYKWSVDWTHSPIQPPSLLNLLISMFLQPGTVLPENQLYPGQAIVQSVLLLMALVCVPCMLIIKPYYAWKEMHDVNGHGYIGVSGDDSDITRDTPDEMIAAEEEGTGHDEDNDESHDFSDIVVHQVIHTIEFCLGGISHTASYLRLWALSLAHAQLSEVLWDGVMEPYINPQGVWGWTMFVIMGSNWLNMTLGGLCLIEGLSAFLHAMRLHWVEANSKHFEGGGHPFKPLKFDAVDASS